MEKTSAVEACVRSYDLVFLPYRPGFCFAFPCSALGVVDLDALTDRVKNDYLLVRTLVGRDFGVPHVLPHLE